MARILAPLYDERRLMNCRGRQYSQNITTVKWDAYNMQCSSSRIPYVPRLA